MVNIQPLNYISCLPLVMSSRLNVQHSINHSLLTTINQDLSRPTHSSHTRQSRRLTWNHRESLDSFHQ